MSKVGGRTQGPPAGPVRLAGRALLGTQSDERLVKLARQGSEPAFEAIVQRYRGPLGGYCRRVAPPSRVDDVLQHTFLSAYRTLRSDGRDLSLKPWLFRVAHNAALDALRREARGFEQLDPSLDGVERPDQAFDRKESLRTLLAGLGDLPERQRAALVLRELEGRSYKEIEHELGVSRGSLRQLLHRGRSNLRAAATAITPYSLLLRPDTGEKLVLGAVTGAGAAKAGALIATTAVVGAVALGTGGGDPRANAEGKSRNGSEAVMPTPYPAAAARQGRRSGDAGPGSGRARADAGGDRGSPRSRDGSPQRRSARSGGGPASGPPALDDDDYSGADDDGADDDGADDSPGDDSAERDDSPADDDSGADDGGPPHTSPPPGGGDDDGDVAPTGSPVPELPDDPVGEDPADGD
jgi:RNA polymerase sigma factor (sigma-70 family)